MALIASRRHRARDLEYWNECVEVWQLRAETSAHDRLVLQALNELSDFDFAAERCYVGTSWGKDSTVLCHLAWRVFGDTVPIVWVNRRPFDNPDCELVRDAFLARHRVQYQEEILECELASTGGWQVVGIPLRGVSTQPKQIGFARVQARLGPRYISGVRAEESSVRKKRVANGLSTRNTCAPLGNWLADDVFAYLLQHDLPIHPAYACTAGRAFDPRRLRVGSIGGPHGRGHGRQEWERLYYADAIRAQRAARV